MPKNKNKHSGNPLHCASSSSKKKEERRHVNTLDMRHHKVFVGVYIGQFNSYT